jgi:adenine-specific DNA-methyltransferase
MSKTKLELTWIGKDKRPKLEPRILLENPGLSYHAKHRVSDNDQFDNKLIFGDNLLALKALEQNYAGKVKCVFIDPPYNTGQAFEHYDDGLEHSIWLSLMRERFEVLRRLLKVDGVFFCQLNDEEVHYAKVLLDEIFGRNNFLNQISVKMKLTAGASGGGEDKRLKKNIEYILIYAKDKEGDSGFKKFNDVFEEENLFDLIDEMESSGKSWKYTSIITSRGTQIDERIIYDGVGEEIIVKKFKGIERTTVNELIKRGFSREAVYIENFTEIFSDTNAQTSIRTRIIDEFEKLEKDELLVASYVPRSGRDKGTTVEHLYISPTIRRVIWIKDTAEKRGNFLFKMDKLGTYWEGFPLNNLTKEGGVQFPQGKKPEALLKKILELATNPGDLVLDSFAGSGTTGAVAHKMGRRWIMIELGEHCHTHIIPRLKRVIDGEDPGGISKAVDWQGGGGFRYYSLAPSLLEQDRWGNWVVNKNYNPAMLAEALCKLEGFTYAPSDAQWWNHGYSSEQDFIYVTTQNLSHQQLEELSEEVGGDRSLLVCCAAFRGKADQFANLTLKKIPKMVLSRCEWAHDDYSLNVANLPMAQPEPEAEKPKKARVKQANTAQNDLFGEI